MKVQLGKVEAGRVDVDLGATDGTRSVHVTDVRGLEGEVEQARGATVLRAARARSAALAGIDWVVPGGGRLTAASPATVAGVAIDGELAPRDADRFPLHGRASIAELAAGGLTLELPGVARVACDAGAIDLALEQGPLAAGHLAAARFEVGNLQTSFGAALVRASGVEIERPRLDWSAEGRLGGAAGGTLSGVTVSTPGLSIEIDCIELPQGARTSGASLMVPELSAPKLRVVIEDIVALFRRRASPEDAAAAPAPARAPFDFRFLDRVTGRLDVDMILDLSVPVIGRREATHQFRIPIVGGVINYREIERSLSSVEDAFIDLEVRGRQLVLERAIPILGLEKPLVVWDLDDEELELAKKRLVRLRTIPRMRLASKPQPGDKGGPIAVRGLQFQNVDVALSLPPPQPGETDSVAGASVGELKAAGRLDHATSKPDVPITTTATLSAQRVAAGPLALPLGKARIAWDAIEVGAIEDAVVEFQGLRPGRASFTARQVVLRGVRIAPR